MAVSQGSLPRNERGGVGASTSASQSWPRLGLADLRSKGSATPLQPAVQSNEPRAVSTRTVNTKKSEKEIKSWSQSSRWRSGF